MSTPEPPSYDPWRFDPPPLEQPTTPSRSGQPIPPPPYGQSPYAARTFDAVTTPEAATHDAAATPEAITHDAASTYDARYWPTPAPFYGAAPGQPYGGSGYPSDYPSAPFAPVAQRTGSRKKVVIVGLAAVLVAALLATGYAVFIRKSTPAVTYQGQKVDRADAVLKDAETNLSAMVAARHGVSASSTRCYFAVPNTPAAGAKQSDIGSALRCGPVIFVDGDTSRPFLSFALSSSPAGGRAVSLTAARTAQSSDATALSSTEKLRRPDGRRPPSGAGGLQVPSPPPADNNFLGSVDLGRSVVATAPPTAVIGSKSAGIRMDKLGEIGRYGSGDSARTAPAGQKLISFTLSGALPTNGDTNLSGTLSMTVVIDGTSRPLPDGADPYVVAVPSGVGTAVLQTKDSGVTQTISLLDGKPGTRNVAVGQRTNHVENVPGTKPFTVRLTGGGISEDRPAVASIPAVVLEWWPGTSHTQDVHPASPALAYLHVSTTYLLTGPPRDGETASDLGPFGFQAEFLSLTMPNGQTLKAKDISSDSMRTYAVFEVPASFTTATFVMSGSLTYPDGFVLSIPSPVSFAIRIAAG